MEELRFFGSFPTPLKKALEKVITLLKPRGRSFWLYLETPSAIERIAALSAMLVEIEKVGKELKNEKEHDLSIVALTKNMGHQAEFQSENLLDRLPIPYSMEKLFKLAHRPIGQLAEILKNDLLQAISELKAGDSELERHSIAVRPLWNTTTPKIQNGALLRYSALIVDDRVTDPGSPGYTYCCDAARKLSLWGWDVLLAPTLQDALQHRFRRVEFNDSENTLLEVTEKLPIEHFELVFLDIARPPKGLKEDKIEIEGIRRDLLEISRARSVLRFPQVYMLSHISARQIAHLCHALGADYYFEKSAFLRLDQNEFDRILAHTMRIGRGDSIHAYQGEEGNQYISSNELELDLAEKDGWTTDAIFSDSKINDQEKDVLDNEIRYNYALVRQLFSRANGATNVKFIKRFGEGFSGSMTLLTQPCQEHGPNSDSIQSQKMRIIKIANLFELARELTANARFVQPFVASGYARIESQWTVGRGLGAISYERAGSSPKSSVKPIGEYLEDLNGASDGKEEIFQGLLEQICESLTHLHLGGRDSCLHHDEKDAWIFARKELLPRDWQESQKSSSDHKRQMTILRAKQVSKSKRGPRFVIIGYDSCNDIKDLVTWRVLEEDMQKTLGPEEIIRPAKHFFAEIEYEGKDVFGPSTYAIFSVINSEQADNIHLERLKEVGKYIENLKIPQRLERLAKISFLNGHRTVPWGYIHGDLHLLNIMVEPDTGNTWMIDYGKTAEGPLAWDYVQLAFDIRMRFLAPNISRRIENEIYAENWTKKAIKFIEASEPNQNHYDRTTWQEKWINRCYEQMDDHFMIPEALFLFRVLQIYIQEPKKPEGLVAMLWAAWLLDRRLDEVSPSMV